MQMSIDYNTNDNENILDSSASNHCATTLFSILFFYIQSSCFIDSLSSDRNFKTICILGLGLTAHIIDHCKLIVKYHEGTNNTWYNVQFKKFEPLEYNYDVCETILL
ncbi:Sialyltransferase-like protein 5, partial [Mucuna pruriens]